MGIFGDVLNVSFSHPILVVCTDTAEGDTHDTDPHPEHPPTDTPTGDPIPPESPADPDLGNTEPCEAFTLDDSTLEHLMDAYSPSYSVNTTHIYHVSKHSSSHYGSLIDRGANGGLDGSDV